MCRVLNHAVCDVCVCVCQNTSGDDELPREREIRERERERERERDKKREREREFRAQRERSERERERERSPPTVERDHFTCEELKALLRVIRHERVLSVACSQRIVRFHFTNVQVFKVDIR